MRVIAIVCIIAMFGIIGFRVAGSYYERKKLFFNFQCFLKNTKSNMNLSSKKLMDILNSNLDYKDNNTKKLLGNYINILSKNMTLSYDNLFEGIDILTTEESECIFDFFKGFGMYDINSQLEEICATESRCIVFFELASEDAKKYGMLYAKLGLIVGAFVALIIV